MSDERLLAKLRQDIAAFPADQKIEPPALLNVLREYEKDQQLTNLVLDDQRRERLQFVDMHFKQVAIFFDKAAAYTNIVILAGYATFFALFSAAGATIPIGPKRLAFLLMVVSATTFVFYEVFKTLRTSATLITRYRALSKAVVGTTNAELREIMRQFDADTDRESVSYLWIWGIATAISVLTALASVAIVASAYVIDLAR